MKAFVMVLSLIGALGLPVVEKRARHLAAMSDPGLEREAVALGRLSACSRSAAARRRWKTR